MLIPFGLAIVVALRRGENIAESGFDLSSDLSVWEPLFTSSKEPQVGREPVALVMDPRDVDGGELFFKFSNPVNDLALRLPIKLSSKLKNGFMIILNNLSS